MDKGAATTTYSPAAFFALAQHPIKLRLFLLRFLPAAWFSGLRVVSIGEEECTVSVPYRWFTRNPFRSTYFACLAMAGEMSTGLLVMASVYKRRPAVSMLVTGMQAKFYKKATARTAFTCKDGASIRHAVQTAIDTGTPQTVTTHSSGSNAAGELIAEFQIEWSIKARS